MFPSPKINKKWADNLYRYFINEDILIANKQRYLTVVIRIYKPTVHSLE